MTGGRGQERHGRPNLPEDEVRKVHLAVYVSEEEAQLLRAEAEERGHRSFSEWAREVMLRLARQGKRSKGSGHK